MVKQEKIISILKILKHKLIGNIGYYTSKVQFNSVQLLSRVPFFQSPWTAARQASLCITNSQSLLKLMSIESVMLSNHLILSSLSLPTFNLSQHQDLFQ